jgi:hypothetical protein
VIDFWRKKGSEEQEVACRFFLGRDEEPEATNASWRLVVKIELEVTRAVVHPAPPVLLQVGRSRKLGLWRQKRVQG